MGFMDRAKQLADQAQAKLEEAQQQFNAQQQQQQPGGAGPAVEYDQHGRPVRPVGDPDGPGPQPPAAPLPSAHPAAEAVGPETATEPARTPQPPSGAGGLTSGDPLAG